VSTYSEIKETFERAFNEIGKVIVGKEEVIKLLFVSLLSGGHVILEGHIGVAKTLISKAFARVIGGTFKRIQCTPDLLPADILGSYIFNQKINDYVLRKGPIFANIVLLDEINRANPRTQSAFLEAMQEGQVTIEGVTLKLPEPFMAIATRVFIEEEGVFPIPKVQLDRFMFRIPVTNPTPMEEVAIISRIDTIEAFEISSVLNPATLLKFRERVKRVTIAYSVKWYIVNLVNHLRRSRRITYPPSPRATISLYKGARALAFIEGRDYVIPDDVKQIAFYALNHRVLLKPEAELEGISISSLIRDALELVPVPR